MTKKILADVCEKITGRRDFTVDFDNDGYNIGRLAKLEYNDRINYISFSEFEIKSRNSFFQSFPSALVQFYQDKRRRKRIFFYFLEPDGNIETPYFEFMYRLMKTAGTEFLNEADFLSKKIIPFNSTSDIISQRDSNRNKNSGNASTYMAINEEDILQIFGKTYGANKYETTLISIATHRITRNQIEVYEIQEGDLKKLPEDARHVIINLGIKVITSDLKLERKEFEENDSLRSPTYLYNLLEKLGEKKCYLCDCEVPQIIQGAHIWPVASIKKLNSINLDKKLELATDGDNGLWLCNNHHKLFDMNILLITKQGRLKYKTNIKKKHETYLLDFTINHQIADEIRTPGFVQFIDKRNKLLNESHYSFMK